MRVAMIAPIAWRTPPRHYGPWEQVTSRLTEALVSRGVDVTLFATQDSTTGGQLAGIVPAPYNEDPSIDAKVWEYRHLAHVFEQAGLATVGLSIMRGQAERARPPRMLHCDFPLGRPLGRPGDAAFQHRVLAAALGLLARTDVPVLVDFDASIIDDGDQPLACTLPPFHDPNLHPAVDEALGLRAAYERNRIRSGLTNVGRVGDADRIRSLVETFVRIAEGTPWEEAGLDAVQIGQAGLDIAAHYYNQSVARRGG